MRAGARSGIVAESDGATGQAVTGPQDFGPLGRCTNIGAGARRDRFSTIDERGRRCLCEPAHGLRKCRRAMARRGRLVPDLRISAPSVVARILARARDATDFRPSMNGVGGACASRRTVWESGRERWRDGAGVYRTSGFRPPRSLHAYWRGRATRPIFDHRETGSAVLARAGARSARAWEGDRAPAQSFRRLRVSGHNHACTHVGAGGRRGRFSTIEGVGWLPRTVCESVGGRSRDGVVFSQTSGIRSQSCLLT